METSDEVKISRKQMKKDYSQYSRICIEILEEKYKPDEMPGGVRFNVIDAVAYYVLSCDFFGMTMKPPMKFVEENLLKPVVTIKDDIRIDRTQFEGITSKYVDDCYAVLNDVYGISIDDTVMWQRMDMVDRVYSYILLCMATEEEPKNPKEFVECLFKPVFNKNKG